MIALIDRLAAYAAREAENEDPEETKRQEEAAAKRLAERVTQARLRQSQVSVTTDSETAVSNEWGSTPTSPVASEKTESVAPTENGTAEDGEGESEMFAGSVEIAGWTSVGDRQGGAYVGECPGAELEVMCARAVTSAGRSGGGGGRGWAMKYQRESCRRARRTLGVRQGCATGLLREMGDKGRVYNREKTDKGGRVCVGYRASNIFLWLLTVLHRPLARSPKMCARTAPQDDPAADVERCGSTGRLLCGLGAEECAGASHWLPAATTVVCVLG